MKKVFFLLVLLILSTNQALAEVEHFCDDPQAEAEWEALIQKYPNDLNVQTLHALRIGLCEKIDQGELGVPDAIAIFEAMRSATVNRAFQKRLQSLEESEL